MARLFVDPIAVRDGNPSEEARVEALVNERLAAAVQEATAPLHSRIDHLTQNRDSLIREKRELEGRSVSEAQARADERPKAIDFAITRTQARNPAEYRRARDEAAKHGLPLILLNDQKNERRGEPRDVFMSETRYHIYAPSIKGDPKAYQEHKAEAERRGLRFNVAYSREQMPAEAFDRDGK